VDPSLRAVPCVGERCVCGVFKRRGNRPRHDQAWVRYKSFVSIIVQRSRGTTLCAVIRVRLINADYHGLVQGILCAGASSTLFEGRVCWWGKSLVVWCHRVGGWLRAHLGTCGWVDTNLLACLLINMHHNSHTNNALHAQMLGYFRPLRQCSCGMHAPRRGHCVRHALRRSPWRCEWLAVHQG
jgi:hypothetical protein